MSEKPRKKTLFGRYLAVSIATVLVGFTLLGVMLTFFVMQFSQNEKQALLQENASSVAEMMSENIMVEGNRLFLTTDEAERWKSVMMTIAQSLDAEIFLTDVNGDLILCSEIKDCRHRYKSVDNEIMSVVLNREYFENGTLGGIYPDAHFTSGMPVIISGNSGKAVVGAVFVSTQASSMFYIAGEIVKIFLMAAVATLAIMFCMSGIFTYNMVKPLRQMAIAAKKFGAGDFSSRVKITTNDEIGQLAGEFNNMADSLALSEGTRRSFIANVSHELKTPMTTIGGFVDGILDGTIPPDRQSYYLNIVSTEVKRLSRLVQSMLALSRIDSGTMKLNKQKFNLTEIIIETLLTFEQRIELKHINIMGLEDISELYIDGDKDMLHQVVYNIMENAVKFTNENGYIRITAQKEPQRTVISIENSGEGINSEEIKHIFERFYKTDKSRSVDKNGMGLGLYIVKTILRLHGGDITAYSELGRSCRFTFWLPVDNNKRLERDKSAVKQLKGEKKEIRGNKNE